MHIDDSWYLRQTEFLGKFNHCNIVNLRSDSDVALIIPKRLREKLVPPLYNVKHLEFSTYDMSLSQVEYVDGLLWISPHPDILSIKDIERCEITPLNKSLKFTYDESMESGDDCCCCSTLPIICWRHSLKEVKMKNYRKRKDEEGDVMNYFRENAKILEWIDVPIVTRDWGSQLPQDVMLHILSLLSVKDRVCTSMMSLLWRDAWTNFPTLEFDREFFSEVDTFEEKCNEDEEDGDDENNEEENDEDENIIGENSDDENEIRENNEDENRDNENRFESEEENNDHEKRDDGNNSDDESSEDENSDDENCSGESSEEKNSDDENSLEESSEEENSDDEDNLWESRGEDNSDDQNSLGESGEEENSEEERRRDEETVWNVWIMNLKIRSINERKRNLVNFVKQTLKSRHEKKITTTKLVLEMPFYHSGLAGRVDRWIRYVVESNVKELVLDFKNPVRPTDCYILPQIVLSSTSITVLSLQKCHLQCGDVKMPLKKLSLSDVMVEDDKMVEKLINSSRDLMELKLFKCHGLTSVKISSQSLNNLSFIGWEKLVEVEIDCPNLLSFTYGRGKNITSFSLNAPAVLEAYFCLTNPND